MPPVYKVIMLMLGTFLVLSTPFILYLMIRGMSEGGRLSQKYGIFFLLRSTTDLNAGERKEIQDYRRNAYIIWAYGILTVIFAGLFVGTY